VHPGAVAVGDVTGDGKLDVVVTNFANNTLSVLAGNGDGTFAPPVAYPTRASPTGVAIADLNRDGRPDFLVTNAMPGTGQVGVLLTRCIK
jgi:hypothetical protein